MVGVRELTVDLGERSYPIYIGEGLLDEAGRLLAEHRISKKSPLMIITDQNIAERHLPHLESVLREAGFTAVSAVIPAGEASKSLSQLEKLVGLALENGLD